MRFQYSFLLFAGLLTACSQAPDKKIDPDIVKNPMSAENEGKLPDDAVPMLVFDKTEHNFGRVFEGEKVTYAFRFENTGNADLIIRSATGSCGCTVPEYPKEPIKPGAEGTIRVSFDSRGRVGHNDKSVTLLTNAIPNMTELKIAVDVVTKP